jgi:cytoskeletal protein RodZ
MKGNEIDNLFREKLGPQKITPSADLWNKVEGNLDNKKKGIYFWLSIAAGILIIFTIGKLALNNSTDQANNPELQANVKVEIPTKDKEAEPVPAKSNDTTEKDPKTTESKPAIVSPIVKVQDPTNQLVAKVVSDAPQKSLMNENVDQSINRALVVSINKIDISQSLALSASININKPIVMPLSILDVSMAEYDVASIETSKKRKFSMLDGILSLAKGVNSAKETLSDIRTVKNDFVSKELKYGISTETEPEVKTPNSKDEY